MNSLLKNPNQRKWRLQKSNLKLEHLRHQQKINNREQSQEICLWTRRRCLRISFRKQRKSLLVRVDSRICNLSRPFQKSTICPSVPRFNCHLIICRQTVSHYPRFIPLNTKITTTWTRGCFAERCPWRAFHTTRFLRICTRIVLWMPPFREANSNFKFIRFYAKLLSRSRKRWSKVTYITVIFTDTNNT